MHYHGRQEEFFMATLTVTARGQVTFRKEVLKHLGIKPGEKIELNRLPQGKAELKAARRMASLESIFAFLKDKGNGKLRLVKKSMRPSRRQEQRQGCAAPKRIIAVYLCFGPRHCWRNAATGFSGA